MKRRRSASSGNFGTAVLIGVAVTEFGLIALTVLGQGEIRATAIKAAVAIVIAYGVYRLARNRSS